MEEKVTNYRRCYHFLCYVYNNKNFRLKHECKDTFIMMKRHHNVHGKMDLMMKIELNDLIEQAKKKPLKHPNRISSECELEDILVEMQRVFAR